MNDSNIISMFDRPSRDEPEEIDEAEELDDDEDYEEEDPLPPALLLGLGMQPTFKSVVAYIRGYADALSAVHGVSGVRLEGFPMDVDRRYCRSLRAKGRLRWNNWERTLLAEATGWQPDPTKRWSWPDIENLTPEQDRAALLALVPIIEDVKGLPPVLIKKLKAALQR